jgi:flagellar hook-basal body complex protein FliE
MPADPLSNALAALSSSAGLASSSLASPSLAPASLASATLGAESAPPFSHLLQTAIASEQGLEAHASSAVQGLISGSGVDVHQAMIATQKANLAFEMALAVRNKAVAAYQQVMQMQF